MNPRQRQGLLLLFVAVLGLIAVFALIANYVTSVSHQVGPKIEVLTLARSVPAYQQVTPDDLGEIEVPRRWAPSTALTDPSQALQLISDVPLTKGTVLEQGMLSEPSSLTPGQRKIAIIVNSETGVAGQVEPGDTVDIVATYQGSNDQRSYAEVVVPNVTVLGVGQQTSSSSSSANQGLPVTLSLTPAQVLRVSYAESFAQEVRLSIIAPGSSSQARAPTPYIPAAPR